MKGERAMLVRERWGPKARSHRHIRGLQGTWYLDRYAPPKGNATESCPV